MPKVSVILCFYNEEWFALLRSVWSVILTSPPELIDEVLLVDDGSTMHHLHGLLDEYLAAFPMLKVSKPAQHACCCSAVSGGFTYMHAERQQAGRHAGGGAHFVKSAATASDGRRLSLNTRRERTPTTTPPLAFASVHSQARVVRAGKRIGLIQARMLGSDASRDSPGRVLIFLDSHIEPVVGWVRRSCCRRCGVTAPFGVVGPLDVVPTAAAAACLQS